MENAWSPPRELGDYRLLRRLGEGGMGEVWLAEDRVLARPVAIKFAKIEAHAAKAAEIRQRFLLEGRALARISHPNLVGLYHAAEIDDHPYLVTERLEGTSLDDLAITFASEEVPELVLQLARGVSAIHRAGVVHRDIKPANVFRTRDGSFKLIDLGLAASWRPSQPEPYAELGSAEVTSDLPVAGKITDAGHGRVRLIGTPWYLAPECWRGHPATPMSDLYSLGATLFDLLTGKPPFDAPALGMLFLLVQTGERTPLSSLRADVHPEIAALIDACLAREPDERPESAEDMVAALEALEARRRPHARAPTNEDGAPHRGLEPYREEHRALFFGRERELGQILEILRERSFAMVLGSSGSGKTSLLCAGVIARAQEGGIDRRSWRCLYIRPGRSPILSLLSLLEPLAGAGAEKDGRPAIVRCFDLVQRLASREPLLLVFDQLEESLANAQVAGEVRILLERLATVGPNLHVLVGLRSDALSRLESLHAMRSVLLTSTVILGPLEGDALRRAVVEPLVRRGYTLESEAMLEEILAGAESLPLLAFALAKLWQERDRTRRTLSAAALEAMGGIKGALAQHAERAFQMLPEGTREEARRMLIELAMDGGARRSSGVEISSPGLARLVESRLIVATEGERGPAYALAQSVLAECWPRLHAWVDEEGAERARAARISRAAAEWDRLGRREDELWLGGRLRELAAVQPSRLGELERAFVSACARAGRRRVLRLWLTRAAFALMVAAALILPLAIRRSTELARAREVAEERLERARALSSEAQSLEQGIIRLREDSFAAFDRGATLEGERLWSQVATLEAQAGEALLAAGEAVEYARASAPGDERVKSSASEILQRWLSATERNRQSSLAREIRGRLMAIDKERFLVAANAPAELIVRPEPGDAALALFSTDADVDGRRTQKSLGALEAGVARSLPPGAYLILAGAKDRAITRLPFLVQPREHVELALRMPLERDVPQGFVYIPPGRGLVGSAATEPVRKALGAEPEHWVSFSPFLIQTTEVTLGTYLEFLREQPESVRQARRPRSPQFEVKYLPKGQVMLVADGRELDPAVPYCRPGVSSCAGPMAWPVAGVSSADAEAFAAWMAAVGRARSARLCTRREWERAARGGDGRIFPFGDRIKLGDANVNFPASSSPAQVSEVSAFPRDKSPFEVLDLAGNLFEWVVALSQDGAARFALRGGAFDAPPELAQSAAEGPAGDALHASVGFRLCADLP